MLLSFVCISVLSNNTISEIDISPLRNLTKLQLSHNCLRKFPDITVRVIILELFVVFIYFCSFPPDAVCVVIF